MSAYLYPTFLTVALVLGMWVAEQNAPNPTQIRKTYLFGVVGGILGARLWYGLQYGSFWSSGGLSFFGFGLGALAAVVAYHRWDQGSLAAPSDFPDAVAPSFALGAAIHRIGCFYSGCCFGTVCELPWAVQYGPGSHAYQKHLADGLITASSSHSLPIHPTQLYETLTALLAFVVWMWLSRTTRVRLLRYELVLSLALCYAIYRFLMEFLRDDAGGRHFGPLTFSQATSIAIFVPALWLLLKRRRQYRRGKRSLERNHPGRSLK